MPALATAANTRTLWIGSPDAKTNAGKIFATPVSIPGSDAPTNATLFVVQIKSTDNQNLAHTVLVIDANKQGATGLSLETFFDPDGGDDASSTFCGSSGSVITCDYGSLPARTDRTVAVVVDVTSDYVAPANQPLFWAKVTTNNENGTNQQLFIAASGPSADDPDAPSPGFSVNAFDPDKENTFVPAGQAKQLFTSAAGGSNKLQTTVNFTSTGGDVVAINEGDSTASLYRCPTGLTCTATTYSEVITSSGAFTSSPYFTWKLTALVPKNYTLSQGFVAHYLDGARDPDWILLFKNKSSFCGTAEITANGHCIKTLTLSKPVNGVSTLTVEVVMDHQGGLKY